MKPQYASLIVIIKALATLSISLDSESQEQFIRVEQARLEDQHLFCGFFSCVLKYCELDFMAKGSIFQEEF